METAAGGFGALGEAVVFLSHFKDLPDPRQRGKVIYPLDEVLLLCLLAVLAGAETFVDIASFRREEAQSSAPVSAVSRRDALARSARRYFCHARCRQVPALLRLLGGVADRRAAEVIAIDGKTVRRSYQKKGAKAPIHMVSAFAARQRLVLGQVKVAEKSNEIVAIPALLDMLAIEGAIVTIDAMGCQRDIAEKIVDKKADYVLALKGNQGTLREDVELFAAEQKANGFKDTTISRHQTVDGDHGRIETRTYTAFHDVAWLQERHDLARIERHRHGREHARNRRQNRTRDPLLHHLTGMAGAPAWAGHPQPLGHREQPPLGDGHDLPRRRMPHPHRSRPRQLHHPQAHRPQPDPKGSRQASFRAKRKVAAWDDDFLASLIAA